MPKDPWTVLKPYLSKARIALGVAPGAHPFKPRPAWETVPLGRTAATAALPMDIGGCRARARAARKEFVFAVRKDVPGDTTVINEVYCCDTYRLAQITEPPQVVFDFGAHIGTFAVLLKQLFPQARVYCFEPHPTNFALLRANTAHLPGVHLFEKALSYSDDVILIEAEDCTGGNFVAPTDLVVEAAGYHPLRRVEAVTLEDVFQMTGVERVDLVKWDCEGGEVDAFRHMTAETAGRFHQMVGEYHVEAGGIQSFLELARGRFPGHRFFGRDEDPAQNIGWFSADARAA